MKKNLLALILAGAMVLSLAACSSSSSDSTTTTTTSDAASSDEVITLVGGITQAKDTPLTNTLELWAELVYEKTNGTVVIDIKTDSALGGESEMTLAMQMGTIDFGLVSTAPLSGFVPDMGVIDLPFLFDSRDHAWAVLTGEIGDELFAALPDQGLIGLAYVDNGFRCIYTSGQEVRTPDDLANLKIRVMESDVYIKTFEALGASPVPMSSTEVYTGLQQGTIDAAENSVSSYNTLKHYEVAPVFSQTIHTYSCMPLIMSEIAWEKLSADQQTAVMEAAYEAAEWHIGEGPTEDEYFTNLILEEMEEVTFVTVDDLTPFREACASVYDYFAADYRDGLIDDILNYEY